MGSFRVRLSRVAAVASAAPLAVVLTLVGGRAAAQELAIDRSVVSAVRFQLRHALLTPEQFLFSVEGKIESMERDTAGRDLAVMVVNHVRFHIPSIAVDERGGFIARTTIPGEPALVDHRYAVPLFTMNGDAVLAPPGVPRPDPLALPIDVGDDKQPSGKVMTLDQLLAPELPSLVHATAIVRGIYTIEGDALSGYTLRATATFLYVEEREHVVIGLVDRNPASGYSTPSVNGVPVVMESDVRFAPWNRVVDTVGAPMRLEDLVPGSIVSLTGYQRGPVFRAREVIWTLVATTPPGQTDVVTIRSALAEPDTGRLRVRGTDSDRTATVRLVALFSDGSTSVLAPALPVDPITNEWVARFDAVSPMPSRVRAESTSGGSAEAAVVSP
jgi:hypothetical protein